MTAKPRARASAQKTPSAKSRAASPRKSAAPVATPSPEAISATSQSAPVVASTVTPSPKASKKPASASKKPASASKKPASASKKPASASKKASSPQPVDTPIQPALREEQPAPSVARSVSPPADVPVATPTQVASVAESAPKVRKRGLGELSRHAFAPVSAPLTLPTRPRVQATAPVQARPSAALDADVISYLRAELTSLLAVLEEPSP